MCQPMGPQPEVWPSPVSLLAEVSYVADYDIVDIYEERWPIYRGYTGMLMLTRFTVG